MAPLTASPWKHPETGVLYFRKRVPKDLRDHEGGLWEIKKSLRTKDWQTAKPLSSALHAQYDLKWANLRRGPVSISERRASEIATGLHDAYIAAHIENPSKQPWDPLIGAMLLDPPVAFQARFGGLDVNGVPNFVVADEKRHELLALTNATVSKFLGAEGLNVDTKSRSALVIATSRALQKAALKIETLHKGGFPTRRTPLDTDLPASAGMEPAALSAPRTDEPTNNSRQVAFAELCAAWAKERSVRPKTAYTANIAVSKLLTFLGFDDAARVRRTHILDWKNAMVAEGLSPKTIRDGRLALIRAILQWGVDNSRIALNPVERVKIDARRKPGQRKKVFTNFQAKLILESALNETHPVLKWTPWLCAYSGARISEIAQLRKSDIRQIDGIWCLEFKAEAGSVKNENSERIIPIHSAILDLDFLTFVEAQPEGPIFSIILPDMFGSRGGTASDMIREWVREGLKIDDPRLQPSHAWRHRFKSLSRTYALATDITNAILSHARKSVGDDYGEFSVASMKREIEKIPHPQWEVG